MRKTLLLLIVLALPACSIFNKPKPHPTPTPTPTPTPAPTTHMLLRATGNVLIHHDDGTPFNWKGCWFCCWDAGNFTFSMGWPALNDSAIDLASREGCTVVGGRVGPFLSRMEPGWDFGPYVEVNGKADLSQFDPRFWNALAETDAYGELKGIERIWSLIDGWGCRHGQGDSSYAHPWAPENNIQGYDALSSCGQNMNDIHRSFVRQTVQVLGPKYGVMWEGGNEIGTVRGYTPEWTNQMRQLVMQTENEFGYPVHLFGENGGQASYYSQADMIFEHNQGRATTPKAGKPTVVTEFNPNPALSAQAWFAQYCAARRMGTHFDLWRDGMDDANYYEALRLMRDGTCPDAPTLESCPKPLAEGATVVMHAGVYPSSTDPKRGLKDSSVYVEGDTEFCRIIHGVPVARCHLEGWPRRSECEMALLGMYVGKAQACPIWQFNSPTGPKPCLQASDPISCDHFGDPLNRDNPDTPAFEGLPIQCGEQRDAQGKPMAGPFAIGHGAGEMRSCRPDGQGCSKWLPVDY